MHFFQRKSPSTTFEALDTAIFSLNTANMADAKFVKLASTDLTEVGDYEFTYSVELTDYGIETA